MARMLASRSFLKRWMPSTIARKYLVTISGRDLAKARLVITSSWGKSIRYCVGSIRMVKPAFFARRKNSGVQRGETRAGSADLKKRNIFVRDQAIAWKINRDPKSETLPKREMACLLP